MKTAEFKYLLLKLLSFIQTSSPSAVISGFQPITQTKTSDVTFLTKEKHPFCSQYSPISDVSDVVLMMVRRRYLFEF